MTDSQHMTAQKINGHVARAEKGLVKKKKENVERAIAGGRKGDSWYICGGER